MAGVSRSASISIFAAMCFHNVSCLLFNSRAKTLSIYRMRRHSKLLSDATSHGVRACQGMQVASFNRVLFKLYLTLARKARHIAQPWVPCAAQGGRFPLLHCAPTSWLKYH
jgi:hypothetical protein